MISKEEVRQAIQDLKVRRAAGPSAVTAEMIKAAGEQAVDWLTSICNRIVKEEAIPESWQMSELVPPYIRVKEMCWNAAHLEASSY